MKRYGCLYIVSGPSGSGKTSLCRELIKQAPYLRLSVSCTTRPKREGEIDGVDYHFMDEETFFRFRAEGAFLEHACVHGHWYGTRATDVRTMLNQGWDVLLEIDWQGASQVARKFPEACRVFVLPPSMEELEKRMRKRGLDSEEVIRKRMAAAEEEIAHADEAEFRIINKDFDEALADLTAVYRAHRLRLKLEQLGWCSC